MCDALACCEDRWLEKGDGSSIPALKVVARRVRKPIRTPIRLIRTLMSPKAITIAASGEAQINCEMRVCEEE
jgi:hypothetical protein